MKNCQLLRASLAAFLLASCAPPVDFSFEAVSENLSADATINQMEFDFRKGQTKLSGEVAIKNLSSTPQNYSNKWLWLGSGESVQARAYLDNITSNIVDVGEVQIQPGSTLELNVYWVFPDSEIEKLGNDAFVLEIRSSDKQ
jgi:hypothetical protein